MARSKKNDNWKWVVKFAEDDPIAYYSFTSSGIPQGYEEFWKFIQLATRTRKLISFTVNRITKEGKKK